MTIEDYMKNLRKVNNDKDFSPEYLVSQIIVIMVFKNIINSFDFGAIYN